MGRDKVTISGPWCVAGDFQQNLFDHEKQDGGPVNSNGKATFSTCTDSCQLIDLGFQGQTFTWQTLFFPKSNITHLPINSYDHSVLWLRLGINNNICRRIFFKFLGSLLEHPEFKSQINHSWSNSDNWKGKVYRLTTDLKSWNRNIFGNTFKRKHRIIKKL